MEYREKNPKSADDTKLRNATKSKNDTNHLFRARLDGRIGKQVGGGIEYTSMRWWRNLTKGKTGTGNIDIVPQWLGVSSKDRSFGFTCLDLWSWQGKKYVGSSASYIRETHTEVNRLQWTFISSWLGYTYWVQSYLLHFRNESPWKGAFQVWRILTTRLGWGIWHFLLGAEEV